MKKTALVVAAALVLGAGWFFVSPLFIDRAVDEGIEFMAADGQLDMGKVMAMPESKRLAMKDELMAGAAEAPDTERLEPMPPEQPRVLASGTFVDADAIHKGSGTATLYALPNGTNLVRFEDFKTTNGPALVVYLAKHPDPRSAADVAEGGFLKLGKLKGNVGNQNYPVPASTEIGEYQSVVIWCELFGVLFSPAALERTGA